MTRDVLVLTLRTLKPGEEIECTRKSFKGIRDRVNDFLKVYGGVRFIIREWAGMAHIRRVS